MHPIRQRIAAKALILHGSKILILREAATYEEGTNIGKYHLPGGRIEPGEPFMDGLLREVKEETGLEVTVEQPLYVGEWHPTIKGEQNHIVAVFFMCRTKNTAVTLSEEHDQYQWIAPEGYGQFPLVDPDDKVIRTYITGCLKR